MTTEVAGPDPAGRAGAPGGQAPRFGPTLALWMALMIALQAVAWLSGLRGYNLAEAVEHGAAQVEARSIGEVPDDVIRKAIGTQQDTLVFWATLRALGDFVGEPMALAARAILAATLFAGLAALTGRPIRFDGGLTACARAQGFWVLGLAVHVALMVALQRPEVETSATLLLPPGPYPAALWVSLRQVETFALLGWLTMAVGAWRRGQSGLLAALLLCGGLWLAESAVRIGLILGLGAGMRLTLTAS